MKMDIQFTQSLVITWVAPQDKVRTVNTQYGEKQVYSFKAGEHFYSCWDVTQKAELESYRDNKTEVIIGFTTSDYNGKEQRTAKMVNAVEQSRPRSHEVAPDSTKDKSEDILRSVALKASVEYSRGEKEWQPIAEEMLSWLKGESKSSDSFNACSGCGKDHDPENCITGFNDPGELRVEDIPF